MIIAAARALAVGDPLGALNRVALRDDAAALALRGVAMAQLGDLARARALLQRAQRAFAPKEALARARCVVAETEIALVSRDLAWPTRRLDAARATLESQGDRVNAAFADYLEARHHLLVGRVVDAQRALMRRTVSPLPPALEASRALVAAGIAMRRIRASEAREAFARAAQAARRARIPALFEEVQGAARLLDVPAARLIGRDGERALLLDDVEALLASNALVVDGCRHVVRQGSTSVSLVSRPVLLALVRALAEAWPGDVTRDALVARAFRGKVADESYRARLRVEIGRLRAMLRPLAGVTATKRGFALAPRRASEIVALGRIVEEKHAATLALLADGESWSTSALALALGNSQRNVQRALETLASEGKVRSVGRGRARRWMTPPVPGFATALLLPTPLRSD